VSGFSTNCSRFQSQPESIIRARHKCRDFVAPRKSANPHLWTTIGIPEATIRQSLLLEGPATCTFDNARSKIVQALLLNPRHPFRYQRASQYRLPHQSRMCVVMSSDLAAFAYFKRNSQPRTRYLRLLRTPQLGCAVETSLRKSKSERQLPHDLNPALFAGNCVQPPQTLVRGAQLESQQ
jgi:hypothetical protein